MLCHTYGCFISTARRKYSLFLQLSHRRNPQLRHAVGYSFGTSRKKQPFSMAQPPIKYSIHEARQQKNWIKRLYFQHTVGTK